ncbi:MAG: PKD domain-containing protein [Chitinophagaceae bacterium]
MSLANQFYHTLKKTLIIVVILLTGTTAVMAQNPVANFSANVTSGCAPLTVTFTDQSTGNPTSWNWEFSNGTLANVQNPVVSFATPGTYSVKLVVQNANGIDQIERIDYITVFPAPSANFTSNLTLACVPSTIQFTDQSTTPVGTITNWDWDFGDGNTSTQQNPTNTYTNVGFYTVTLTVTSSTGCKSVISKGAYIRVVGSITTDFSFSQPSTCQAPFAVNFQNQSSGPGVISYNWDFGNSQTSTAVNPTTIYNTAGSYTVTLNAISDLGCTGTIQKTVVINSVTTDFNAPTNVCLNQPVTFQNNSSAPPVNASWDFGDGTTSAQINPSKTFLVPGTYQVKLINQYASCTDSATKTITVNDKPVVDFIVDDSASCKSPFTVQFTDLTPGAASWAWDFGDGNTSTQQNPSHTYTTDGDYTVTLTVTTVSGCSNTKTKTAYIRIKGIIIGLNLPQGGCIPFTYTPQANIITLDSINTYTWDLGEPGAIFNIRNPPPYTYTTAGAFTVSLTVTTATGCTATATVPNGIRTGIKPIVNFSFAPSNTCASDTIHFTDMSTTTPGAEVTWLWDFGDGNFSDTQNPQHVYMDTGALTINLIVSNNGCKDSLKQVIKVIPPVALFNYKVNCLTQQVTFTDSSLADPAILPLTYSWDFGNGNTSVLQNPPPVTYVPGTYDVTLIVTNGPCSYKVTRSITLSNEPADFSISRNPVCKNETFTLTATTSNAANIASYTWTIGGTTIANAGRSINYSIPATGSYSVTLALTDNNGCVTTKTINNYIIVNGPTANFAPANAGGCLNKTTTFIDGSTPAGTIRNWRFDFGDGTQQNFTAPPFTHTYTQTGGYDVALTVTDAAGCTDTYALPTEMLVTNPAAGFKADTFYCPQAPLQFVDTSAGAGLTYLWNFGDGATGTGQNPQHSYPAGDNIYTVSLVITDIAGCTDSVKKTNYIKIRKPKAAFDIRDTTTICPPLNTHFDFHGTDFQTSFWDFGDGSSVTAQNISHYYGSFGHYIPTLYLTGPGGCMDSAKASVTVYDVSTFARINYGPTTTACNSLNVDFDLVVPPGYKFIFYYGDGTLDSSRQTHLSHFYSRPSFNTPVLVIMDTVAGCQASIQGSPRIDVLGAVPLFGVDKKEFCDSSTVVFTDFTTKNEPIISTVWTFGDGGTASSTDATHKYTTPGTYVVTLSITTQSNCNSTYKDTIQVYRTPVPSILSRDTICVNIAEPFDGAIAVADTLTNWNWNFGNGQTSTNQNETITYTTAGDFTIQLITSNKLGCSDTATKQIYVSPRPTATPVLDPITIVSGGSTNLAMIYTGNIISYNWSPVTRLSCTDCAIPVANPRFTSTYKVDIEDIFGCKNSSNITVNVICNNQNFFVPNTFSPNGDGQNETFYPRGTGLYNVKSMTIFNRWGQIVFDRRNFAINDPSLGWNGTFNGQKASADVYIYIIEVLCDNNTTIPIKGNVTLLR